MPVRKNLRFADVVDHAVNWSKNRPVKTEWFKFTPEAIEFLHDFRDNLFANIIAKHDFIQLFDGNKELAVQCLIITIEQSEKFWPFVKFLENLICNANQFEKFFDMQEFYEEVLILLVNHDKPDLIDEVLKHTKRRFIYDSLIGDEGNPIFFMEACKKDKHNLVKVFVKHGLRLSISSPRSMKLKQKLKKIFKGSARDNELILNVFKLITKKSYILSCYEAVIEAHVEDHGELKDCQCPYEDRNKKTFHHCPSHVHYEPRLHCYDHVECNDPIFQCFELAKLAEKYADRIPEYREEYIDIAFECQALSVDLLNECSENKDIECILQEANGASKYMRYTDHMMYPRLRLAIVQGFKEFVGHVNCQQALRQVWYGSVSWQEEKWYYKLFHVLLIGLISPWFAFVSLIVQIGRDIQVKFNIEVLDKSEMNGELPWPWYEKWFYLLVDKSKRGQANSDAPLNRFLIFTGNYMVFIGLIIYTNIQKNQRDIDLIKPEFDAPFILLVIFALSMIGRNFLIFRTFKSITSYFKFWRVYDLSLTQTLVVALICRAIRVGSRNACRSDMDECQEDNWYFEDENVQETLNNFEDVMMAMTATLALSRVIYWLQLNDKLGPIVINMARVVGDVLYITTTFALVCIGFTLGLVFTLSSERYHYQHQLNTTNVDLTDTPTYDVSFGHIMYWMAWTVLDPGPKDDEFYAKGFRGYFAGTLLGLYQVTIIIMLFNLLIAIMNATVQRYHERRHLYWKFYTTSVLIDFFDEDSSLFIPFSTLKFAWTLIFYMGRFLYTSFCTFKTLWMDNGMDDKGQGCCEMSFQQKRDRRNYVRLMLSLIENLKESNIGEKDFSVFGDQTALNIVNDQYLKDCMIKIDALEKQIKKQDLKLNMVLDC